MKKLKTILVTLFFMLYFIGCSSKESEIIDKVKESSFDEYPTLTIEGFFENRKNISDVEWELITNDQGEKKVLLTLEYDFSENKAMDDFADYYSGIDFTFDAKGENFIISWSGFWVEPKDDSYLENSLLNNISMRNNEYTIEDYNTILYGAENPEIRQKTILEEYGRILILRSIHEVDYETIECFRLMGFDLKSWMWEDKNIIEYYVANNTTLKNNGYSSEAKQKVKQFADYLKRNGLNISDENMNSFIMKSVEEWDTEILEKIKSTGYNLISWKYYGINILKYMMKEKSDYLDSSSKFDVYFNYISYLKNNGLNVSNDEIVWYIENLFYLSAEEKNEFSSKWNEIFKK